MVDSQYFKGTEKTINKTSWWPKMARLGAHYHPKIPPKKVFVGPFLRSFPGNEAHKLFFWGPRMGGLGWGPKSLC